LIECREGPFGGAAALGRQLALGRDRPVWLLTLGREYGFRSGEGEEADEVAAVPERFLPRDEGTDRMLGQAVRAGRGGGKGSERQAAEQIG
jgi:hypothetical protein